MQITKKNMLMSLYTLRFIAALAMLAVVVTGVLGYGDMAKLFGASVGAFIAILLKVLHVIP